LFFEAVTLINGIIQFTVCICNFFPVYDQLKSFYKPFLASVRKGLISFG
jgi:hypothetical protein